jgi:uncharacterized membrane protein
LPIASGIEVSIIAALLTTGLHARSDDFATMPNASKSPHNAWSSFLSFFSLLFFSPFSLLFSLAIITLANAVHAETVLAEIFRYAPYFSAVHAVHAE